MKAGGGSDGNGEKLVDLRNLKRRHGWDLNTDWTGVEEEKFEGP